MASCVTKQSHQWARTRQRLQQARVHNMFRTMEQMPARHAESDLGPWMQLTLAAAAAPKRHRSALLPPL